MSGADYLIDTSVLQRLARPEIALELGPRVSSGKIALCSPVVFELGFSAQTRADHRDLMDLADAFERAPTTEGDHARALTIQSALADRSQHRAVSLVDALVAAVAESRSLVVLHYDEDFDLIHEATGIATEWVVPAGTVA